MRSLGRFETQALHAAARLNAGSFAAGMIEDISERRRSGSARWKQVAKLLSETLEEQTDLSCVTQKAIMPGALAGEEEEGGGERGGGRSGGRRKAA